MNICIVSTFSCSFEDFNAWVEVCREKASSFITDHQLAKVDEHKSMLMLNCIDMDKLEAFLSTPEMLAWDQANDCVDTVYALEQIS